MHEYETLDRELIEILSKSFIVKDLEALGKDVLGNKYNTHKLEGLNPTVSISISNTAKRLIFECRQQKKLEALVSTLVQLDGNYFNARVVKVFNLDNLLYQQAQSGFAYDYKKRKFIKMSQDKSMMLNWGILKDGAKYTLTIASVDIAGNSKLVNKYSSKVMEVVYNKLWGHMREILMPYNGRVWSWQGDGGLLAFPPKQDTNLAVLCCMNILLSLPVFNLHPDHPIEEDIVLRIALDRGMIKFFKDTGRIVSETINYAAHLEKLHTLPWGIAISDTVHENISPKMQSIFSNKEIFEGRDAYSKVIDHSGLLGDDTQKKVSTTRTKTTKRKR